MNKIILIGNYHPDKQQSMNRFAEMLKDGFSSQGLSVEMWLPKVFFGALMRNTSTGVGKWFGYIDKWILFSLIIRWRVFARRKQLNNIRFHICDHSNAPYLAHLPKDKTLITCHDVLAIRGALGYKDAYCDASRFGQILQKWILNNLSRSVKIASVSSFTHNQLLDLTKDKSCNSTNWKVVYNGFNAPFKKMSAAESAVHLAPLRLPENKTFILHVGSNLVRKNRKVIIDMVSELGDKWNGYICFAGHVLDNKLVSYAASLGLSDRIVSIANIDHQSLVALYSSCEAFIFPSLSEGFGWPVIEAQACETAVIASNLQPMPEVSGGAAIHVPALNAQAFAAALISLKNDDLKKEIIRNGLLNVQRFDTSHMVKSYIELHRL